MINVSKYKLSWVIRKYKEGERLTKLANSLGVCRNTLKRLLVDNGVELREDHRQPFADPTEEEIRQRAEEVRSTWSSEEERARRGMRSKCSMPIYVCTYSRGSLVYKSL